MATRRMFSQRIIDSGKFLRMPASARLLYYDLCMRADDDGIVEAYQVLRTTGCTEDDLQVLMARGYVMILNEDLVTYITDWTEHNSIRPDRKVDSIYADLLVQVVPDAKIVKKRTKCGQSADKVRTNDGQMTDKCQTSADNPPSNVGIGKDRLGEVRIGKGSLGESAHARTPEEQPRHYGIFNNVRLTDTELTALKEAYPDVCGDKIDRLSEYIQKGRTYPDHFAILMKWAREDAQKAQTPQNGTNFPVKHGSAEDLNQFYGMVSNWANSE